MTDAATSAAVRAAAQKTDSASAPAETPATAAPVTLSAPASAEALASARAEGVSAGSKDGAAGERVRIKGILGSEHAEGRRGLAEHMAFDTDMNVEAAEAMLQKSAKESAASGSRLDRVMAGAGAPHVGATPPAEAPPKKAISATDIYAARAAAARPVSG